MLRGLDVFFGSCVSFVLWVECVDWLHVCVCAFWMEYDSIDAFL